MNDTCRYIATGDSIPLPLSLPLSLQGEGDGRGGVKGSGNEVEGKVEEKVEREGARVVVWDASTLCVVASIQISSSIASGTSSTHSSIESYLVKFDYLIFTFISFL